MQTIQEKRFRVQNLDCAACAAKIDQRCGIHIHVDATTFDGRTLGNLAKIIYKQEPLILNADGAARVHRPGKEEEGTMTEHAMSPDESLKENTQGMLRLFVYGTLKRGFWNHDRFCRGVLDVREAVVRGCLSEMHSGIPVLQVPDGDILANGTADPLADVATQARLSEQMASHTPNRP